MDPALGLLGAAFPRRPITLRLPGAPLIGRLSTMAGWLVFIGIAVATLVFVWPAMKSDWQMLDSAQPVPGGVVRGQCQSKLVFYLCELTISSAPPPPVVEGRVFAPVRPIDPKTHPVTRDVTYMFVGIPMEEFSPRVMADPRQPVLLSTDLGIDRFYNRAITLVVLWGAMLAGAVISARLAWRSVHVYNAALASSGQVLVPVVLQLVGMEQGRLRASWTLRDEAGRDAEWRVPAAARPFILGFGNAVLGAAGPASDAAFPLDAGLLWLDLSEEERAAIFAAQAQLLDTARARMASDRADHPG